MINKMQVKELFKLVRTMGEDGVILVKVLARNDPSIMSTREFVDWVPEAQSLMIDALNKYNLMEEEQQRNWFDAVIMRANQISAKSLMDLLTAQYHAENVKPPLSLETIRAAQGKSHPGSYESSFESALLYAADQRMDKLLHVATVGRKYRTSPHLWFMHDGKPICRYGVGEKDYE